MKTKEELHALKEEIETIRGKLRELSDNELKYVTGGKDPLPGYNQEQSNTNVITTPGFDSPGK